MLFVLILLALTSIPAFTAEDLKLDIARVFMHNPGDYTVMHVDNNAVVHAERIVWGSRNPHKIGRWLEKCGTWSGAVITEQILVADVPQDKPMWVHLKKIESGRARATIHIHSPKEISGAEWSTGGKHPTKAMTVDVE
jgi:hypothetical protein